MSQSFLREAGRRIPRKNIKPLAGRQVISIVVENLLSSNCFDQVLVSTKDEEIASSLHLPRERWCRSKDLRHSPAITRPHLT